MEFPSVSEQSSAGQSPRSANIALNIPDAAQARRLDIGIPDPEVSVESQQASVRGVSERQAAVREASLETDLRVRVPDVPSRIADVELSLPNFVAPDGVSTVALATRLQQIEQELRSPALRNETRVQSNGETEFTETLRQQAEVAAAPSQEQSAIQQNGDQQSSAQQRDATQTTGQQVTFRQTSFTAEPEDLQATLSATEQQADTPTIRSSQERSIDSADADPRPQVELVNEERIQVEEENEEQSEPTVQAARTNPQENETSRVEQRERNDRSPRQQVQEDTSTQQPVAADTRDQRNTTTQRVDDRETQELQSQRNEQQEPRQQQVENEEQQRQPDTLSEAEQFVDVDRADQALAQSEEQRQAFNAEELSRASTQQRQQQDVDESQRDEQAQQRNRQQAEVLTQNEQSDNRLQEDQERQEARLEQRIQEQVEQREQRQARQQAQTESEEDQRQQRVAAQVISREINQREAAQQTEEQERELEQRIQETVEERERIQRENAEAAELAEQTREEGQQRQTDFRESLRQAPLPENIAEQAETDRVSERVAETERDQQESDELRLREELRAQEESDTLDSESVQTETQPTEQPVSTQQPDISDELAEFENSRLSGELFDEENADEAASLALSQQRQLLLREQAEILLALQQRPDLDVLPQDVAVENIEQYLQSTREQIRQEIEQNAQLLQNRQPAFEQLGNFIDHLT